MIARRPRARCLASTPDQPRSEPIVGELKFNIFKLEHLGELSDERILGFGQIAINASRFSERTTPTIGRRPMNSGIIPNFTRSSGEPEQRVLLGLVLDETEQFRGSRHLVRQHDAR